MELVPFIAQDSKVLIKWIDSAELNRLWGGPCYQFPLTHEQIEQHCAQQQVFPYLFMHQGAKLGFVELYYLEQGCYRICRVFIAPHARGNGLAKQMLQSLMTLAKREHQCRHLSLGVFSHNTTALQCYQSLGFETVSSSISKDHNSGEEWLLYRMEKWL